MADRLEETHEEFIRRMIQKARDRGMLIEPKDDDFRFRPAPAHIVSAHTLDLQRMGIQSYE